MMRANDADRPGVAGCPQPRRTAFTLIELLVVISIIALLVSILIPSLTRARSQAKQVQCLAHLRGMGQAGAMFAEEKGGRFQLAANNDAMLRIDASRTKYEYDSRGEILAWPVAMAQAAGYTGFESNYKWGVRANDWVQASSRRTLMNGEFKLATCPADEVQISTPFYPESASLRPLPPELNLPTGTRYWGFLSFGINEDIVGADDRSGPNPNAFDCWKDGCMGQVGADPDEPSNNPCKPGDRLNGVLARVFDPGTCMLMIDAGPDSEVEARNEPQNFANLIISSQSRGPYLEDFHKNPNWVRRVPRKRHPEGRLNVLFADFHAAPVRPVEFYTGDETRRNVPTKFDTKVRVSPYKPWRE